MGREHDPWEIVLSHYAAASSRPRRKPFSESPCGPHPQIHRDYDYSMKEPKLWTP